MAKLKLIKRMEVLNVVLQTVTYSYDVFGRLSREMDDMSGSTRTYHFDNRVYFSRTVEYFHGLPTRFNTEYCFFMRNCTHETMRGLHRGILDNGMTVGEFMRDAGFYTISWLPGTNMARLQFAFGNTSHTQAGALSDIHSGIRRYTHSAQNPNRRHPAWQILQQEHQDRAGHLKDIRPWFR